MQKTNVCIYCRGDSDYRGTIIFQAESKKQAIQYVKDYINCHSTKMYPLTKGDKSSYVSKFMRIWIEKAISAKDTI